jgi:hypothetical protein
VLRYCDEGRRTELQYYRRGKTWLSNEGPFGLCQTFQISRLDEVSDLDWQYSTRKVVTGKDANPSLPTCSIFDQQEYVYKRVSDVLPPDADSINWSQW